MEQAPIASSKQDSEHARQDRRAHLAREIIETVVLTLVIFLAVRYSVQPYRVDGPSMQPGLHTGELVFVNLLAYDFGSPQRGDIVVLHPPGDSNGDPFIKRVIAIPGDTITITATSVYVDGAKLNEQQYTYPVSSGEPENLSGIVSNLKLGPNQYWVMGDHRQNSDDSRVFGAITRDEIIGKAEGVMWPVGDIHWFTNYSGVFAGVKQ